MVLVSLLSHIYATLTSVTLEFLKSHSKVQSHDECSVANALTSPTGFSRYIHVS